MDADEIAAVAVVVADGVAGLRPEEACQQRHVASVVHHRLPIAHQVDPVAQIVVQNPHLPDQSPTVSLFLHFF